METIIALMSLDAQGYAFVVAFCAGGYVLLVLTARAIRAFVRAVLWVLRLPWTIAARLGNRKTPKRGATKTPQRGVVPAAVLDWDDEDWPSPKSSDRSLFDQSWPWRDDLSLGVWGQVSDHDGLHGHSCWDDGLSVGSCSSLFDD